MVNGLWNVILPDRLHLPHFVVLAILQWFEPDQLDKAVPLLLQFGHVLRNDQNQKWQIQASYSLRPHMEGSTGYERET